MGLAIAFSGSTDCSPSCIAIPVAIWIFPAPDQCAEAAGKALCSLRLSIAGYSNRESPDASVAGLRNTAVYKGSHTNRFAYNRNRAFKARSKGSPVLGPVEIHCEFMMAAPA